MFCCFCSSCVLVVVYHAVFIIDTIIPSFDIHILTHANCMYSEYGNNLKNERKNLKKKENVKKTSSEGKKLEKKMQ